MYFDLYLKIAQRIGSNLWNLSFRLLSRKCSIKLSLKCFVPLGPDFLFKNGTLGTLPFLDLIFKILTYIIIAVKQTFSPKPPTKILYYQFYIYFI